MNWPWSHKRFVFWLLVAVILGCSFFLINEVTRHGEVRSGYIALARIMPGQQEQWLAMFILREVGEVVPDLSVEAVDIPGKYGGAFEVTASLDSEPSRQELAERMSILFLALDRFGYYGERRPGEEKDTYYIFRDLLPWFTFEVWIRRPYQVALVIDDFGYSLMEAERFIHLPGKGNISVFPHLPLSTRISEMAYQRGREVLIHLPMEAIDPLQNEREPFLLRTGAGAERVREMIELSLQAVPHARGLNNHKGSRATSDTTLMKTFMDIYSEKGLYFLDSVTAGSSVAYTLAEEYGIHNYRRDIFLDGESSKAYVLHRLWETVEVARTQGYAVAIGHPKDETYRALREFFNTFNDPQVEFVYLSQLNTK